MPTDPSRAPIAELTLGDSRETPGVTSGAPTSPAPAGPAEAGSAAPGRPHRRAIRVALVGLLTLLVIVVGYGSLLPASRDDGAGEADTDTTPSAPATGDTRAGRGGAVGSDVPMPRGNQAGWRQVFADDFSRRSLGSDWVSYDGAPIGDPGGYFSSSRVKLRDSKLTIGAWPDPQRRDMYVSGGVSNRNALSQVYGKYEIRFRMDRGTGIAYALLLWPTGNAHLPEIDIAEDNGKNRDRLFTTMHSADGDAHIERNIAVDTTQWHTAGIQWSPGRITYTLDGRPWSTITDNRVPSNDPMSLALQSQAWHCGNSWQACPDASTPKRVNLEIDWVVAYARSA